MFNCSFRSPHPPFAPQIVPLPQGEGLVEVGKAQLNKEGVTEEGKAKLKKGEAWYGGLTDVGDGA